MVEDNKLRGIKAQWGVYPAMNHHPQRNICEGENSHHHDSSTFATHPLKAPNEHVYHLCLPLGGATFGAGQSSAAVCIAADECVVVFSKNRNVWRKTSK